jgi:hypothetical protein
LPGFKDFMKKAKELAEKGVALAREAIEFEQLLRDFDEVVANTVVDVLSQHGYRPAGQKEEGDYYRVTLAIEDPSKVEHIIERDIIRRYKPKDREKIVNKFPDIVEIRIYYTKKVARPVLPGLSMSSDEDVAVHARLKYIIEREGGFFSRVKREERELDLGGFSFASADFVDTEKKEIDRDKLKDYLESKLRGLGLF